MALALSITRITPYILSIPHIYLDKMMSEVIASMNESN